jgi:molecular chaperone DnaK (HSP70)
MLGIGIDLGTSYSSISVYYNGKVETVLNIESGSFITPSVIYLEDKDSIIVGEEAKTNLEYNYYTDNTIYEIKRLIGRKYSDPKVQNYKKKFTYTITSDDQDNILIKIQDRLLTPEQLSSYILLKMKQIAQEYLNQPIDHAVITVPAYFNNSQRLATKKAGELAGLQVNRIINEPTAAAIAYHQDLTENKTILVYDLGGGTLDLSILVMNKDIVEVVATDGDINLGGSDMTNLIFIYLLKDFKIKNPNINTQELINNKKIRLKLKRECERVKKLLSNSNIHEAEICIDCLYGDIDYTYRLTRVKLDEICEKFYDDCMKPVYTILEESNLQKSDIDEIILVGGATRVIKIKKLLENYFNKPVRSDINPDLIVSQGAAIQSALLQKDIKDIRELVLLDVTQISVGVENHDGNMIVIIEKNTVIPCTREMIFSTVTDNQPNVIIKIYEGEKKYTKDNNLLGVFELSNLTPMLKNELKIVVTFHIDNNNILTVTAAEENNNKNNNKIIIVNKL